MFKGGFSGGGVEGEEEGVGGRVACFVCIAGAGFTLYPFEARNRRESLEADGYIVGSLSVDLEVVRPWCDAQRTEQSIGRMGISARPPRRTGRTSE
jgi:hypothetical protein